MVYLVQSNGGVSGLAKAGREPARLLLSGPSGGGGGGQAARGGPRRAEPRRRGTWAAPASTVSVVHEGAVAMVNEGEVDGLPVRLPMIEMRTIGAGGGSIAWVDDGGRTAHRPAQRRVPSPAPPATGAAASSSP